MPLTLYPPRAGRSPNWTIRGTYLGIYVERSAGTPRKAVAARIKSDLERAIERGEHAQAARPGEQTFLSAAIAYIKTTGNKRFLRLLIEHLGDMPISEIDQDVLDAAALALYPTATPATRNRAVYTPAIAVLRSAKSPHRFVRPKGAKGKARKDYLTVEDATAIIVAARQFDPVFATMLAFLLYTGCRLGEALGMTWERIDIESRFAYISNSKNGDDRSMLLRPDLVAELQAFRPENGQGRVFPFEYGGWLVRKLLRARLAACGLALPGRDEKTPPHRLSWVKFHTFRHTWATWMRRYSGVDLQGLVATGNWRDARSAARYAHVKPRDEWEKVDKLPALKVV